jgi:hypothetical protein
LACGPSRAGGAPGQRRRESDSSLSSARPQVGDDRRGPPVIGCGAGKRQGGLAAVMGRQAELGHDWGCWAAAASSWAKRKKKKNGLLVGPGVE